jgi:hypothetical protein
VCTPGGAYHRSQTKVGKQQEQQAHSPGDRKSRAKQRKAGGLPPSTTSHDERRHRGRGGLNSFVQTTFLGVESTVLSKFGRLRGTCVSDFQLLGLCRRVHVTLLLTYCGAPYDMWCYGVCVRCVTYNPHRFQGYSSCRLPPVLTVAALYGLGWCKLAATRRFTIFY